MKLTPEKIPKDVLIVEQRTEITHLKQQLDVAEKAANQFAYANGKLEREVDRLARVNHFMSLVCAVEASNIVSEDNSYLGATGVISRADDLFTEVEAHFIRKAGTPADPTNVDAASPEGDK
tara:strand:- start:29 stop:391 length:363 start_codon:yes stop_codon:yes gene_type:complete